MSTLYVDTITEKTLGNGVQIPGHVVQVVSTIKTDSFTTSSTSYVDITGLSLSITPTSSSNKILVLANVHAGAGDSCFLQLVRDTTAIGNGVGSYACYAHVRFSATNLTGSFPINYLDSPSTTSATTYKIQGLRNSGADLFVNVRPSGGGYPNTSSHLTLMEIAQ